MLKRRQGMRITRENYEAYLVDFAEGNLSEDLMQEVKSFLVLNPDIQEEFELFSNSMVETLNVSYEGKNELKKIPFEQTSSTSDIFQQLCVAHVEGLNTVNDEQFLHDLIAKDAIKAKELELFEKTKLIVDELNFNEKLTIKQEEIIHIISDANFEEYCIACMEGWLDQKGLVALNDFIAKYPEKKQVLDLYYSTRIKPDLSIVFPDKRKIKRFNILSPTFKKYGSIISSAAAILVFAFMVFYTTTVDDSTKLASSVITKTNNAIVDKNITQTLDNEKQVLKKEKAESILKDPFGFKKISGTNKQNNLNLASTERIVLNPIVPKKIEEIDCPPCKQIYDYRPIVNSSVQKSSDMQLAINTTKTNSKKAGDHAKNLAKVGLHELGRITNTGIKVTKNESGEKTKIAFSSKYFSFSTQVNKKN